jgi:hypothetical protein
MNRRRLLAAGVMLAVLTGLLLWQHRREQLVVACLERGGAWDGARSVCLRAGRIILEREGLRRS